MKSVKLLVFLFGILLLISMISALTTVNIKTLPYQELFITPVKTGGGFEALQQPQFFSADEYGDLKVDFEDFSVNPFEVFVSLKNLDGITIYRKKSSENFVTGTEVLFIVALDETQLVYAPEVEEVIEEIEEIEDLDENLTEGLNETNSSLNSSDLNETNSSSNSTGLSGGVIDKSSNPKFSIQKLIFILAGLVLLIIVYLVIKEESEAGAFKSFGKKINFDRPKKKKHYPGEGLDRTKKELREAKQRVEGLQKKEKIEEVRARLQKDEEALDRLEREQDRNLKGK